MLIFINFLTRLRLEHSGIVGEDVICKSLLGIPLGLGFDLFLILLGFMTKYHQE